MPKLTITDYLERFRTPKAELARMVGISRIELYSWLEPDRYADRNPLGTDQLMKIAEFEGRPFRSVKRDYDSRRRAA